MIKNIIYFEYNRNEGVKFMLYREDYIQKIACFKDMDVIKVITGLRRSGKLTIMRQVQEYYKTLNTTRKSRGF